jgi:hypothetical protein
MSWAAATIGTVALILLAFARGGGGRSQAASPPYAAAPAPTIAPAAAPPVAAPASEPATPPGAAPAAAASDDGPDGVPKPPHHGHYSGKGRVTRGLSVDPFAEAASRGGR